MRILLDERLPRRLKFDLVRHEVDTIPEAGWASVVDRRMKISMERPHTFRMQL